MRAIGVRGFGVLMVGAAFVPLSVVGANADKFPHPERVAVIVGVLFLIGLAWTVVLSRVRRDPSASLASALVLMLLLSSSGSLTATVSTSGGVVLAFGVALIIGVLGSRVRPDVLKFALRLVTVFVLLSLGSSWLPEAGRSEHSGVAESSSALPESLASQPDIYLVLLDGYPGNRALRELYDDDSLRPQAESLQVKEAWSSYPMTIASVASVVEMGHPLRDGAVIGDRTAAELARIMSGQNRLYEYLERQGYRTHHLESGYSRSYCASTVDVCVGSHFLDEGVFGILDETVVRWPLRERYGSSFTQNGLHVLRWLNANLPSLASNDVPDFVMANVGIPHPPMFLDRNCEIDYELTLSGNSLFAGKAEVAKRLDAYLEQVDCVTHLQSDLSMRVPESSILIFFSDHGGDSVGQLAYDHEWTETEVLERLSSHLAVQGPETCLGDEPVLLSDMMRRVLWCLARSEPAGDEPEPRVFAANRLGDSMDYRLDEVGPDVMRSLGIGEVDRPTPQMARRD